MAMKALRAAIAFCGMSEAQFASLAGMSQQQLSGYLLGKHVPSYLIMEKLVSALPPEGRNAYERLREPAKSIG